MSAEAARTATKGVDIKHRTSKEVGRKAGMGKKLSFQKVARRKGGKNRKHSPIKVHKIVRQK